MIDSGFILAFLRYKNVDDFLEEIDTWDVSLDDFIISLTI